MPTLPPRLFETSHTIQYPRVVHYNGYGDAFSQLPNESDVQYAQRMLKDWVPTVSELVAGKPAAQQIAILESKMKSIEEKGLLKIPVIGPFYFQPRYDEYKAQLPVLYQQMAAEQQVQADKGATYRAYALAGIAAAVLGVSYFGLRFYYLVKANEDTRETSRVKSERERFQKVAQKRQEKKSKRATQSRNLNPRRRRK